MNIKEFILKNTSKEDIAKQTKSYCPLPWSHLHVGATGDVLPCCVGDWTKPLGNINKQSFLFMQIQLQRRPTVRVVLVMAGLVLGFKPSTVEKEVR